MPEDYDVGVLIHFPEDVSEPVKVDLLDLADKWDGIPHAGWPFAVALLPVGDYLMFVFQTPDDANLFVTDAEKHLRAVENSEDADQLYSVVVCWSGLVGSDNR